MAELRCTDGSLLGVRPVPVLDRDGVPYEVTLELELDGRPFGEVGERCGFFLTSAAALLREAGDALPVSTLEQGVRAWAREEGANPDAVWRGLARRLPRDRELLALRARDPDDLASTGELRVVLSVERTFSGGQWRVRPRAVLEAWGAAGRGVRAVLDPAELRVLLDALAGEVAAVGART